MEGVMTGGSSACAELWFQLSVSPSTALEYLERKWAKLLEALTPEQDGIGVVQYIIQQIQSPCSFQASPGCTQKLTMSWVIKQISPSLGCDRSLCSPTSAQSGWQSIRESSPPLCAPGPFLDHATSFTRVCGVAFWMPCCSLIVVVPWPVHSGH